MTHPRVPQATGMLEVIFLSSVQGYQTDRERQTADRLKAERPDLTVRVLTPQEGAPLLTKYKLKFGPAVLINNRLEFVGVPRYRMLLERIEISRRKAEAPPLPAAPATPTAAPRPTTPAAPAGPTG